MRVFGLNNAGPELLRLKLGEWVNPCRIRDIWLVTPGKATKGGCSPGIENVQKINPKAGSLMGV